MYRKTRDLVLRFLKVPSEPHPPFGDPASLRVFRAGRNYFNLRLIGWGVGQLGALIGIVFWVVVLVQVEHRVQERRSRPPAAPAAGASAQGGSQGFAKSVESFAKSVEAAARVAEPAPSADPTAAVSPGPEGAKPAPAKPARRRVRVGGWEGFMLGLTEVAGRLPPWAFPLLWVLKVGGFLVYLAQIPVTFVVLRLEYEMRWYIVTDRSLRIRAGAWKVQETTMSFANLQQVEVTQGPLQRLLGLADVRVQSAGGGSGEHDPHADDSMHRARFHGVDNAQEIRDLILERLRRYRTAGLGDPDDHRDHVPAAPAGGDVLAATRELAAEARALRAALGA